MFLPNFNNNNNYFRDTAAVTRNGTYDNHYRTVSMQSMGTQTGMPTKRRANFGQKTHSLSSVQQSIEKINNIQNSFSKRKDNMGRT